MEAAPWRTWPKVCRARHGAANQRGYRSVMLWQPPTVNPFTGEVQGWTALGSVPYRGPLRSCLWTGLFHGTGYAGFVQGYLVPDNWLAQRDSWVL